jgi:hypothetical protein
MSGAAGHQLFRNKVTTRFSNLLACQRLSSHVLIGEVNM